MSNENNQNKKRFINMVKKIKGGVFAFNVDNAMLSGLREPKLVVTAVNPAAEDANEKYQSAKFFLNVSDALAIREAIMHTKPTEQEQKLFQGYQGGHSDKKGREGIEARVMTVSVKIVNGKTYYKFLVENCKGVQGTIKNGAGENVPGVVKPATGKDAQVFAKCSFSANRVEAVDIATRLYMEIQAWRTAINVAMYFRPHEFRYNNGGTATPPRQNAGGSQPPTAGNDAPPVA